MQSSAIKAAAGTTAPPPAATPSVAAAASSTPAADDDTKQAAEDANIERGLDRIDPDEILADEADPDVLLGRESDSESGRSNRNSTASSFNGQAQEQDGDSRPRTPRNNNNTTQDGDSEADGINKPSLPATATSLVPEPPGTPQASKPPAPITGKSLVAAASAAASSLDPPETPTIASVKSKGIREQGKHLAVLAAMPAGQAADERRDRAKPHNQELLAQLETSYSDLACSVSVSVFVHMHAHVPIIVGTAQQQSYFSAALPSQTRRNGRSTPRFHPCPHLCGRVILWLVLQFNLSLFLSTSHSRSRKRSGGDRHIEEGASQAA